MKLSPHQLKILEKLCEKHGTKGVRILYGYFSLHKTNILPDCFRNLQNGNWDTIDSYYRLLTENEDPSRITRKYAWHALFPPAMLEMGFVEEAMLAAKLLREIEE